MKIIPIPCLQDNYSYLIICTQTNLAAIVDPADASLVIQELKRQGAELTTILNTHHHWDHIEGNKRLLKRFPELQICGHVSNQEQITGQNVFLEDGDSVSIGDLKATAIHNPGHTLGGTSYHIEDCIFTGDTLFASGCGRLFEGTPQQMYESLNDKIASYPISTKLYFGHEYTASNLKFAQSVEPNNQAIQEKIRTVDETLRKGEFTTPTTLEEELQTNPFLRCDSPEIQGTVRRHEPNNDLSPVSVFRVVRQLKDHF